MAHSALSLPVDTSLFTGVDVGGTKVSIVDTSSEASHRYATADYPNMEAILDDYFAKLGRRPASITLAMAGPRDDETGAVKLTNGAWPAFNPLEAEERYPGTHFETVNDMVGTAAGVLAEPRVEFEALKEGRPSPTGTRLIIAVSTGLGVAAAVWDNPAKRFVYMASEGGHIGVQPENDDETAYLRYLQAKYTHVSAELALNGKEGIDNLIEHVFSMHYATNLVGAVSRARQDGRPVGAVLLEFATAGEGLDRDVARKILGQLGAMLGSALRDLTIAFKATGGVYLTGSVALALGEFLSRETDFQARFVHEGAAHHEWVTHIPIYVVTNPHVAVQGALALARQS